MTHLELLTRHPTTSIPSGSKFGTDFWRTRLQFANCAKNVWQQQSEKRKKKIEEMHKQKENT
jgi:hypothetical protein